MSAATEELRTLNAIDVECPVCESAPNTPCESWDIYYHDYRPMGVFGPHQERVDKAEATEVCPDCGEEDNLRDVTDEGHRAGEVTYTVCECGWKGNAR